MLGRLGMQASDQEVVDALAECGIGVAGELVRQVRVELLKQAANVERQRVTAPGRFHGRPMRLPPKMPPPR
jgi:hypothetical protein